MKTLKRRIGGSYATLMMYKFGTDLTIRNNIFQATKSLIRCICAVRARKLMRIVKLVVWMIYHPRNVNYL